MKNLTNSNIVKEIIENVKDDMQNEEIIHLVLEKQVSHHNHQNITRGQKIADNIAKFGGSWYFIITFVILLISWMIYNQFSKNSLDPYPFILLNLILSCLSALQAPIIMMSQNRQEQIDRQRNENDYKVNLKTEIIIQDLHNKLDIIFLQLILYRLRYLMHIRSTFLYYQFYTVSNKSHMAHIHGILIH